MENQELAGADRAGQALEFTGNWREYLPIAASNALLTIVTLGIYRFWAAARQRRYLWSRTYVIDDHLEWTGTGKEMFIGFLIVIAILAPFFLFIQFLFPALIARGKMGAASGILTLFYVAIIYLGGFARFRALRYRLSRSWWHGIRGGSDNPGWNYAGESLGRYALVGLTMFIMLPWSTTRLWNSRWNAMSFGPLEFKADVNSTGLKWRWALVYIAPIGAILIAATSLGELEFGFEASTWDWLKLFLGNVALVIVTLGFGLTYWGYRNWSFMVRHARLYGTIDSSSLTQSTTHSPVEAEGFADAFDIGAI